MEQKVNNARRDPVSGAVVFTDQRGFKNALQRRERARQIMSQEQEVHSLRSQVAKLTGLVERLLANSNSAG